MTQPLVTSMALKEMKATDGSEEVWGSLTITAYNSYRSSTAVEAHVKVFNEIDIELAKVRCDLGAMWASTEISIDVAVIMCSVC